MSGELPDPKPSSRSVKKLSMRPELLSIKNKVIEIATTESITQTDNKELISNIAKLAVTNHGDTATTADEAKSSLQQRITSLSSGANHIFAAFYKGSVCGFGSNQSGQVDPTSKAEFIPSPTHFNIAER